MSTVVTGALVAVAEGTLPLTTLSHLVSMGTLLAFSPVCGGIIILRRTEPNLPRPFRTPGMPWVPAVGAIACVAQTVGLPLETWARLFIWLALGLAIYLMYGRRRHTHCESSRS